jgi:type IV pilus assembly protein PilF
MARIRYALAPAVLALLAAGCAAPLSLVGFAGSTVAKTARNYNEAEKEEAPRRHAIAEANIALAIEYMRRGRHEDALAKLEKARDAEPGYSVTYSMLGLLYQQLGEFKLAEANFQKSIRLDKTNPEHQNNYAQFLCHTGRFGKAEEIFLEAAKNPLYQTPDVAYANAGACAWADKDPARAREHFEQSLSLNASLPAALISMCDIEYGEGDYAAADWYLQRYLQNAEHTPRSLWLGVRIKSRTRDLDAQASYALLLRRKFPDSEEAGILGRPGALQEVLALEQPTPSTQASLLKIFEDFNEPELLTDSQLLNAREN